MGSGLGSLRRSLKMSLPPLFGAVGSRLPRASPWKGNPRVNLLTRRWLLFGLLDSTEATQVLQKK